MVESKNNHEKTIDSSLSSNARRDHMANERTFLAWIRTSIGVMAFGFVVEKFALFIKQISAFLTTQNLSVNHNIANNHQNFSSIFGILLVGVGALIGLFSFIKYRKVKKQIEVEDYYYSSTLAIIMTALVVIMGIFLVIYLVNT
ncbi:MAG: DUF202 domain-containing protein [Chlamydiales bacterium]|nr:DUF202 domain-containing protein [Chlamydiales bacterium]